MDDVYNCEKITKLGSKAIRKSLHEFADFDENSRNEIILNKKSIFYKLRNKYVGIDNQTLEQSALVLSTRKYIASMSKEKYNMLKHKRLYRKKENKETMLLQYWAIVKKAITVERMSFREVTNFLEIKYNLKINHSYLFQIWKKYEGEL